jgi:LytR cell envelope-related transcriptional attenuator
VDHPAGQLSSTQPWRVTALIASSVAAVELCILLVVGLIVFGDFFTGQVDKATDPLEVTKAAVARDKAAAKKAGAPAKPILPRGETSVLVLNGNGVTGVAGMTADAARARGYLIAGTDDAPRSDFARSVVMYRPGFAREAKRLGRDFRVRQVTPLDGLRARQLQGAHIVLIVGG